MTAGQVDQTITRLAYEVVERNRGATNLVIFGILKAGAAVADALAGKIDTIENSSVPVRSLDISSFRDDRKDGVIRPGGVESPGGFDVTDRDVLLVDDVLFTGRTIRAALDAVIRFGRPRSIQLLVLIDRGHREYPIQPDYVGRSVVTVKEARVDVDLSSVGAAVAVER